MPPEKTQFIFISLLAGECGSPDTIKEWLHDFSILDKNLVPEHDDSSIVQI